METLIIIIVAVVAICGICAGYVHSRRMRDRSLADEWRLKYEAQATVKSRRPVGFAASQDPE